ncbi:MAG: phosphate acyltransferase PlsX [Eubacteriales bacterium]|nr:phosphate acyltransferase PlsX [Eubacteriales bacterium]
MKIIVDAMGGDNAPQAPVEGALRAKKELGVDIVLVGKESEIRRELGDRAGEVEIVPAEDMITMDEDPVSAVRNKKNSSMVVALRMLSSGEGDAVVSAGSTGALLTGATLIVKRINGIRRAAMAPVLPAGEHGVMLIDCGANAECTPEYLLQFACMGSFYAGKIMGCENPRVGLVSNGTEDSKGDELRHRTFELLKAAGDAGRINFVGNVEGTTVFSGAVDVAVTDGFTGNVLLKTAEGVIKFIMKSLKGVFYKSTVNKLAAAVLKKDLGEMKKSLDVNEVGGTALLGISKPVIKAHGSSDASSIFAAVRQAKVFAESGIIEDIKANIGFFRTGPDEGSKAE